MKFITPFLLLAAVALTACETTQNRRSLYSPPKASGPYSQALKTGSWRYGYYPEQQMERKSPAELAPPSDLAEPPPAS